MSAKSTIAALLLLQFVATPVCAKPPEIKGQPPLIKIKREGVAPYWLQVFDVSRSDVVMKPMTISEAHYSWSGIELPREKVIVTIECDLDRNNDFTHCSNRSGVAPPGKLGTVAASQLWKREPKFLSVPPLTTEQWRYIWTLEDLWKPDKERLIRVARFQYEVDPAQFRKIDATLGPVVETKNAPKLKWQRRPEVQHVFYPPNAWKEGKEGRYSVQCQVQSDLSVICGNPIFDPPENLPYFSNVMRRWPIEWLSEATLPNGQDARGAIFVREYVFSIKETNGVTSVSVNRMQ